MGFPGVSIDTGTGRDTITGNAFYNGLNTPAVEVYGIGMIDGGFINTGDSSDSITGIARNSVTGLTFGIGNLYFGSLQIDTGSGADMVSARATVDNQRANGFYANNPSGLAIFLGSGADKLQGFGTMTADGGSDFDTWDLRGYSITEFSISKIDSMVKGATFNGPDAATALITNFEHFLFDDGAFSYDSLPVM